MVHGTDLGDDLQDDPRRAFFVFKNVSRRADSNRRPAIYKSGGNWVQLEILAFHVFV